MSKTAIAGSMRRLHERIMGSTRTGVSTSTSDIWLLGVCYRITPDDSSSGLSAFELDFSSRILITYRKGFYFILIYMCCLGLDHCRSLTISSPGFSAIGDTKYSSDVNWGCMIRSSQMLVAQVL